MNHQNDSNRDDDMLFSPEGKQENGNLAWQGHYKMNKDGSENLRMATGEENAGVNEKNINLLDGQFNRIEAQ